MQVLAAKAQVFSIILDAVRLGVLPPAPSWGAEDHLCPGMYLPPSAGDLDAKERLPFPSSACLSHQVLRVWLLNSSIESISGFWFPAGVYSLLPRKSLDATVAHSIIVGFCCQLGRKKRKQKSSVTYCFSNFHHLIPGRKCLWLNESEICGASTFSKFRPWF